MKDSHPSRHLRPVNHQRTFHNDVHATALLTSTLHHPFTVDITFRTFINPLAQEMHFALPPRKTSQPPPYARRSSRSPLLRRNRIQLIAVIASATLLLLFLLSRLSSWTSNRTPLGTPRVVIVTPIDHNGYSPEYIQKIKKNREHYAERHGTLELSSPFKRHTADSNYFRAGELSFQVTDCPSLLL